MTDLDTGRYALALNAARRERGLPMNLSVPVHFDGNAHPRDWKGQFKKAFGGMKRGDTRTLPSGVTVEKKYANFKVTSPDGTSVSPKSLTDAVDHAMRFDAKTAHPQSIGGAKSTTVHEAVTAAEGHVEPKAIRGALEKLGLQHSHLVDEQLPSMRRRVLDLVDPPNKPPAKDGTEALKRLKAAPGNVAGRGSSWLPVMDEKNSHTAHQVGEAVTALRGDRPIEPLAKEGLGSWTPEQLAAADKLRELDRTAPNRMYTLPGEHRGHGKAAVQIVREQNDFGHLSNLYFQGANDDYGIYMEIHGQDPSGPDDPHFKALQGELAKLESDGYIKRVEGAGEPTSDTNYRFDITDKGEKRLNELGAKYDPEAYPLDKSAPGPAMGPVSSSPKLPVPNDEQQFGAVTRAVNRLTESDPESFTGAADEIRDIFHAVKGEDNGMDWEAESVLQEIADATEYSKHPADKPVHEWAKSQLAKLQEAANG